MGMTPSQDYTNFLSGVGAIFFIFIFFWGGGTTINLSVSVFMEWYTIPIRKYWFCKKKSRKGGAMNVT